MRFESGKESDEVKKRSLIMGGGERSSDVVYALLNLAGAGNDILTKLLRISVI
jgi:lipoate synthase